MRCRVDRIGTASPADVTGLARLFDERAIEPADVVAVMGKTEGNGCVNDFSRGLAVQSVSALFRQYLGAPVEMPFIMSGGTEGVLCPHLTIISRSRDRGLHQQRFAKALAVGVARTPAIEPWDLGRSAQVALVERAVVEALRDAAINDVDDVHFVQVKCPLLTPDQLARARAGSRAAVTDDTYRSMAYSRGASALGVACALGEVDRGALDEGAICRDWHKYSRVASASAGNELRHCEIVVLGNSPDAVGDLVMDHDVMGDALDLAAIRRAAERAGYRAPWLGNAGDRSRRHAQDEQDEQVGRGDGAHGGVGLVQVFAKAEADPSGWLRRRRHTMLSDSDINHTRHARAAVGAVVASYFGDPMVYVSGGAEHQGPAGGGPVAVIMRR